MNPHSLLPTAVRSNRELMVRKKNFIVPKSAGGSDTLTSDFVLNSKLEGSSVWPTMINRVSLSVNVMFQPPVGFSETGVTNDSQLRITHIFNQDPMSIYNTIDTYKIMVSGDRYIYLTGSEIYTYFMDNMDSSQFDEFKKMITIKKYVKNSRVIFPVPWMSMWEKIKGIPIDHNTNIVITVKFKNTATTATFPFLLTDTELQLTGLYLQRRIVEYPFGQPITYEDSDIDWFLNQYTCTNWLCLNTQKVNLKPDTSNPNLALPLIGKKYISKIYLRRYAITSGQNQHKVMLVEKTQVIVDGLDITENFPNEVFLNQNPGRISDFISRDSHLLTLVDFGWNHKNIDYIGLEGFLSVETSTKVEISYQTAQLTKSSLALENTTGYLLVESYSHKPAHTLIHNRTMGNV